MFQNRFLNLAGLAVCVIGAAVILGTAIRDARTRFAEPQKQTYLVKVDDKVLYDFKMGDIAGTAFYVKASRSLCHLTAQTNVYESGLTCQVLNDEQLKELVGETDR